MGGNWLNGVDMLLVILASFKHHFIREHANLLQHTNKSNSTQNYMLTFKIIQNLIGIIHLYNLLLQNKYYVHHLVK